MSYLNKCTKTHDKDKEARAKTDITENRPAVPDGGYGWVVVFGAFTIGLIVDGNGYGFSSYIVPYSLYFGAERAIVSIINSAQVAIYPLIGPFVSVLVSKYGCRPVGFAGAIVAALGFAGASFASEVWHLILLQGCLAGVGFGMMYVPALVSVGMYFDKKLAYASGDLQRSSFVIMVKLINSM